ncbi:MAG: CDP-alcohol phosphatidyltransferase family protein [Candidatus Coatesbacteria bacterium]
MATHKSAPRGRGIFLLPMMFTTASLVFTSVGMSFMLERGGAVALSVAVLILAASFMDFLDGRIARATNTCSAFGAQYDSMADLVSFGVTPAWMMYTYSLQAFPLWGLAASVWYITCVAFRLARFNANIENTHGAFNGLPCPPAAGTLASFVILMETLPRLQLGLSAPAGAAMAPWIAFGMAGLGWLMVSRTPYSSFKSASATKPRPVWVALTILVFAFTIWAFPQLLFGIALLYILTGLVIRFLTRVRWVELVAPRAVLWAERRLGAPPQHSASPRVIR